MKELYRPDMCVLAASALALCLLPGSAGAQTTAFQVEQFEPLHAPGINILNTATSEVIGHLKPSVGLTFHYADDEFQLVPRADEDTIIQRLIDHQFKADLSAALGLLDFGELGLALPLAVSQKARRLLSDGASEELDSFAVGDLRVMPKVRLLASDGFGLALLATVYLPTGDDGSYHSEGNLRVEPRVALDYRTESGFVIAANIAYQFKKRREILNHISDDVLRWNLGVDLPVTGDGRLSALASLFGAWGVHGDDIDENKTLPLEFLAGAQYWATKSVVLNAGAGFGLSGGAGAPDFRMFATVGYTPRGPGILDADGDGVGDTDDACPDVPEDPDGFQDGDGCPDADNDGDGVLDVDDGAQDASGFGACRGKPEDMDGFEDLDGCPDPDNDADGVPDVSDGEVGSRGFGACMNDPEDMDRFQDSDGCPDPDNDGDGIKDASDGVVDASGFGKCRNMPENFNNFEDTDGCPDDKPLVTISQDCTKIEISEKVYFRTAKAKILERSYPLLNQVADVIAAIPAYDHIQIGGHTDSRGSSRYNRRLSDRRAKSVRRFLVNAGVPSGKLKARGYGEERPLVANDTPESRARNRRVEFKVVGAKCR